MSVTSQCPLNAKLLWLKHDWQCWLLILIWGTYVGWWAEGRQQCVPGSRQTEANSVWHAIRADSHTHMRATFPRCADTAIGNTHFSSNVQERGGYERRLSFNKKHVHISQHSNTKVAFPEKPLRCSVTSSTSFESRNSMCFANHFHLETRIKVLHLPLRGRN